LHHTVVNCSNNIYKANFTLEKENGKVELTINETQAKALIKEVLMELLQEKRDLFYEVILEVIEEIGLANAIREGRKNELVSEDEILNILRAQA
jgi:hypothetical protein